MMPGKIIDLTDSGLLESIKQNEKIAFKEIYKRYWSKLYIYAYNVLREKEICEDIIQEIFIDLWNRRNSVQISELSAYLYQAVKFRIFKHFRQSKYKDELLAQFDLLQTQYKIDDLLELQELHNQINDIIAKLPEQRRVIFQMSRNEELTNKEISEKLNISIQTVKNQISTALHFIRKSLRSIIISVI